MAIVLLLIHWKPCLYFGDRRKKEDEIRIEKEEGEGQRVVKKDKTYK